MIETILISLASGLAFAMRGSGMPRFLWVTLMAAFAYGITDDVWQTLLWLWVYVVAGCLPTNALMSAVHGIFPMRGDGRWQFLQIATVAITERLPSKWAFYDFGIVYGILRNSLAIPAIIMLGKPWLMLILTQGFVYFACGKLYKRNAVRLGEFIIGAIIGWGYL
jgi:hypothetical protein